MKTLGLTVTQTVTDQISDLLGISEARRDELIKVLKDAMKETSGVVATMQVLDEQCENVNELAFTTFHLGSFVQKMQNPMGFLSAALAGSDD